MKHHSAIVMSIAALLAVPAKADTDRPPAISVSGQANISVAPDLALLDAGVTSEGKTAREASDTNNAAMGKVLLALKGLGIEDKDYQTSRLSLQPQYAPNRGGPSPVVGYRAINRVTVKLHDLAKIASIVDAVTSAGANDIGGINFIVSEPSKLLDDAREKAIADSRRKAEIYAKAAGVTLGEPLGISEASSPVPLYSARVGATPMATSTPVAQGEETLSVSVNVFWAIKPAQ